MIGHCWSPRHSFSPGHLLLLLLLTSRGDCCFSWELPHPPNRSALQPKFCQFRCLRCLRRFASPYWDGWDASSPRMPRMFRDLRNCFPFSWQKLSKFSRRDISSKYLAISLSWEENFFRKSRKTYVDINALGLIRWWLRCLDYRDDFFTLSVAMFRSMK